MAAANSTSGSRYKWSDLLKQSDLIFTLGLFGVILLLVVPVPTWILDFLLSLNIGLSMMILLVIIYVKDPPEFSSFPTILLAVTLLRLALNIASTRLILLDGYAGHVIEAFGNVLIQGNYLVGAVVFIILVIINFVVITKGAGRIAEVAARFTLDAMPGKQMAIDAELNAGIIDEVTATSRRLKVQKEADFYGAMDGASKFVRGDAVAGILITIINILGGFAIGMLQKGGPQIGPHGVGRVGRDADAHARAHFIAQQPDGLGVLYRAVQGITPTLAPEDLKVHRAAHPRLGDGGRGRARWARVGDGRRAAHERHQCSPARGSLAVVHVQFLAARCEATEPGREWRRL